MKRFSIINLFLFSALAASGQHERDNWYFGINAAVSLVSSSPVIITGSNLTTSEGCSAISTAAGTILFYTDGSFVYNANNLVMQNGYNLSGGFSSTQSSLIVPDPANSNLYYIFTAEQFGGPGGLSYSKVNMSLLGGLGSVTVKNSPLVTPVQEKITAVKQASGNGYWVITYDLDSISNAYYAYPVTAAGVGSPVISNVGLLNTQPLSFIGCMIVSPDGTKLANAIHDYGAIEISDFSATTGVVSNPFLFYGTGSTDYFYGVAFSQTSHTLYACTENSGKLYQLDMTAGNQAAIIASANIVSLNSFSMGTMYLASDNRIYVANYNQTYLGIINNPDLYGTACDYDTAGFNVNNLIGLGLQNSISGSLITGVDYEYNNEQIFSIFPNPFSKELTINFANDMKEKAEIKLFDIYGRMVLSQPLTTANTKLQTVNLSSGIYIYEVRNNKGIIKKEKVVKE